MMRATYRRLRDAAGKPLREVEADDAALDALARSVWGADATRETYRSFWRRWHELEPRGRQLAEFLVVYGVLPRALSRDDMDALDIAQPYAYALRVRLAADAQTIANGGIGDVTYYSTMTDGDAAAAVRLRSEAIARSKLQ